VSDITIRSGSVVEVDTVSLRRVVNSLRSLVRDLAELVPRLGAGLDAAAGVLPATAWAMHELMGLRAAVGNAVRDGDELAESVESAAALYEAVELLVERDAAAAAGDLARVERLDARLGRLALEDPTALREARRALDDAPTGHGDLNGQALLGSAPFGLLGPWLALPALFGVADALRFGVIPAGARLAPGTDTAVRVRPTAAAAPTPPASLADAARRIPSGGAAQVRVERYEMAGGTRQFAVYVAGTRTGGGDKEPFDAASNVALYAGESSASYEAVTTALRQAGAREGDAVHAFGHSQGAMVLERLALEGTYDTRTLVSFGSPVQADVGEGTLAVSFRHTDDPVAALQSGGHAAGVGAPGSFVVERLADPVAGLRDLQIPAHSLVEYAETAALVDSSGDPRADTVRNVFEGLRAAESAEATDYVAERISPLVVGGGGK
jgi:hypothetical protein